MGYGLVWYGRLSNDFVAVAAGAYHNLALKSDGSLVVWGRNNYGQINVPVGNDFVAIAAGSWHNLAIGVIPEPVFLVEIDIKPGSYPNSINLGSHGLIRVAILSGDEFDATTVDPETVKLAGAGVEVCGKSNKYMAHKEDIDGDGIVDLVVQVATENLDPGTFQDGYAVLIGSTYDGLDFEGLDEITIVPAE